MKRGLVIAAVLLIALGLWFVLTWPTPGSGEVAASAVERIRRTEYPPGTRGRFAQDTWALDDAPPVSPDSTGQSGKERVEAAPPPNPVGQELADGGLVDVLQRVQLDAWLRNNGSDADRAVEAFCSDNEALAKAPLFPESKRTRDAAAYMAPRIDWEGNVRPPGLLHLSEQVRQKISAAGSDWPVKLTVADTEGLDFSWLRELAQFDTWDVAQYGPLRDDADTTFSQTTIPNYISLVQWSKLRLVRALAANDGGVGAAEVRHLAALIHTSGLVIGDAIAQLLLKLTLTARELAVARGLSVAQWPPLDAAQIERFRRVALSAPYMLAAGVSDETVKKAVGCLSNRCSALAEGLGLQRALAPYASKPPGSDVETAAAASGCTQTIFERIRRAKPMSAQELSSDLGSTNTIAKYYLQAEPAPK